MPLDKQKYLNSYKIQNQSFKYVLAGSTILNS
jgi:hypothetical protein